MTGMAAFAKIPVRMSVQDFLAREPGDGLRYELVDGSRAHGADEHHTRFPAEPLVA